MGLWGKEHICLNGTEKEMRGFGVIIITKITAIYQVYYCQVPCKSLHDIKSCRCHLPDEDAKAWSNELTHSGKARQMGGGLEFKGGSV